MESSDDADRLRELPDEERRATPALDAVDDDFVERLVRDAIRVARGELSDAEFYRRYRQGRSVDDRDGRGDGR